MELDILVKQNPWWSDKKAIETDEDIVKWKKGKRKWVPSIIDEIPLKPFALHFIFGPRQVGKTTLLKLLIRRLLKEGIDGKRIFYFRCDKLADFKELDEVVKTYLQFRKNLDIKSSFILLDEITFPKEWFRTIKFYIDVGEFKNDILILTGSLSMELKKEIELFPGRRGNGKDIKMLPLSFREFIKVLDENLYRKLPELENLDIDEIFKNAYRLLPFVDRINELFMKYLMVGGFPLCVKEGEITETVKDTYWSWIKSDLAKIKRSEITLKRVAKAILEKMPSAISLNSIAKEFEIGTHKTVYEYIDVMKKLFIVNVLFWIEPNKLVVNFKKNRKICFVDPFFFYLFSDLCLSKLPDEGTIVESLVSSHLARKYDVFYWKNRREIDIIVRYKNEFLGLEVKWKEKVKGDYSKVRVGKIKNVLCLTKDVIDKEKHLIPLTIFVSLLS